MSERYTTSEEVANGVTHGLGLAASVAGAAALVLLTAPGGDAWRIVSSVVYGVTLISLYTASTLYHLSRRPGAKRVLRVLDHCAIFLLIAGTYTPFMLVSLRGGWGWTLLALVWSLAAAGIVFKVFFTGRLDALSTSVYILMGWLCVVAAKPMLDMVPAGTLLWLLAGGLVYTAGTVFYHNRRVPYSHAVWHLFVIGGSLCHYLAVSSAVLPPIT
ncbi:MAG TPA: hemolysin III family protein [Rubrobacteraceae bacterium]|nr:hemolysin III family protein [Rubrobacteraceae bacterium]